MKTKKYKKLKFRVFDKVRVISGDYKMKIGRIKLILKKMDRVILEDFNLKIRHRKRPRKGGMGTTDQIEAPIHISNIEKVNY
uniref:ribosomal protein L24 n=1 Tax=Haramonas pauciplastida TaxID=478668 RepID=UPI002114A892|nr:ribosomal protein L24 [Haramonas pauciplastida]UTE94970.1 ribosomal protein L24 [Haramonas pauciplastida]